MEFFFSVDRADFKQAEFIKKNIDMEFSSTSLSFQELNDKYKKRFGLELAPIDIRSALVLYICYANSMTYRVDYLGNISELKLPTLTDEKKRDFLKGNN